MDVNALEKALLQKMNDLSKGLKAEGTPLSKDQADGMKITLELFREIIAPEKKQDQALPETTPEARTNRHRYLLVDASSVLVSGFYGSAPSMIANEKDPDEKNKAYDLVLPKNADGKYVNALISFMRTIKNIMEVEKPDYIMFAFDEGRNTFRSQMYPEYKAQRDPKPIALSEQFCSMKQLLKEAGFPVISNEMYEADDIVGSFAKEIGEKDPDASIYLYTKDRDYLQLIDDHTKIWLMQQSAEKADEIMRELRPDFKGFEEEQIPYGAIEIGREECKQRYDLYPEQIVDWKSISGDASDNIPGVKGVGDASTIPLLHYYGTKDAMYADIEAHKDNLKGLSDMWRDDLGIKRSPINKLVEQKDMCDLSYALATIKTDIPMKQSFDKVQTYFSAPLKNVDTDHVFDQKVDFVLDKWGISEEVYKEYVPEMEEEMERED